jgi:hypothetical protein
MSGRQHHGGGARAGQDHDTDRRSRRHEAAACALRTRHLLAAFALFDDDLRASARYSRARQGDADDVEGGSVAMAGAANRASIDSRPAAKPAGLPAVASAEAEAA